MVTWPSESLAPVLSPTVAQPLDLGDRAAVSAMLVAAGRPPLRRAAGVAARHRGDRTLGERAYLMRPDLREAYPLGLTPAQRGGFFQWACAFAEKELGISPFDVLRLLVELDAEPDRGLALSYRMLPAWQARWPHALEEHGWPAFVAGLAAAYGLTDEWLFASRPPAPRRGAGRAGFNLIAPLRYPSGLQQNALGLLEAGRFALLDVACRDVQVPDRFDGRPAERLLALEEHSLSVLVAGLASAPAGIYEQAGLWPRPGVRRAAVWFWELEQVPEQLRRHAEGIDEIWAANEFLAQAFAVLDRPVLRMPVPLVVAPPAPRPKELLGLDPERFTFLFVFDINSQMPRKNPLGLIDAFRRAFSPSEPVELVIKVGAQTSWHGAWWARLRDAVAANGVRLIEGTLEREELLGMIAAADAYVSLHRSEGLGLTMAEAMMLGRPTIATGYSGNLDFMTDENSYLVATGRAPVSEPDLAYPVGLIWGDPDLDDAARQMRAVYDDPVTAARIARRGQVEARDHFDPVRASAWLTGRVGAAGAAALGAGRLG